MATEEKIRTPEEMARDAYNRIVGIAEQILAQMPMPEYNTTDDYKFDFDPSATYKFIKQEIDHTPLPQDWSKKNNLRLVFKRASDGEIALFTKYSHINLGR